MKRKSLANKKEFYDITVVIVCRNGKETTEQRVTSLLNYSVKEVIIVDNASTDGTASYLKKLSKQEKRVRIITNYQNNGFAEANNQGLHVSTGQYVFFLNNDTVLTEDVFSPLLKAVKPSHVAAVQPMILFPNGTIDSIGSYMTPTGFLYHRAHRMKPDHSFLVSDSVYSLKGAAMLWKKAVLNEIGGFDQEYFAYFEETELCHRAINKGYSVKVVPTTEITHLGGFTSNSMDTDFIQFHNTKNRVATYLRHFSMYHMCTLFVVHFFLTQLMILKYLVTGAFQIAWAMQRGVFQGVILGVKNRKVMGGSPQTLQKVTKYPDVSYYLALFSSLEEYKTIW